VIDRIPNVTNCCGRGGAGRGTRTATWCAKAPAQLCIVVCMRHMLALHALLVQLTKLQREYRIDRSCCPRPRCRRAYVTRVVSSTCYRW
jgi:hypothetical protein